MLTRALNSSRRLYGRQLQVFRGIPVGVRIKSVGVPSVGVLIKKCSGNMQQIYKRTPMTNFDFNKAAKQLY